MNKLYKKTSFIMISLVMVVATLSGQNLIPNPSFEDGTLAPWVQGNESNGAIVTDAFDGEFAAKGHLEFYLDSLEAGATYFWIAQAKCLADCGLSNMWIGIRDMAADSLIGNFNFTNHTEYDEAMMTFTAGSGDHRFFQWGQNGGEYVTDDHVLYKEGTANIEEVLAEAKKIQISTISEGVLINIESTIKTADISIHDLSGRLVYRQAASLGRTVIDKSNFAVSGVYVVTVKTDKTRKLGKVSIN